MPRQTEYHFLQQTLTKLHLQVLRFTIGQMPEPVPDYGLRHFLGHDEECTRFFCDLPQQMASHTIYKLTDAYLCNYLLLRLPWEEPSGLLIGPYLSVQLTHEALLGEAERYGVPPHLFDQLQTIYGSIPYLGEESFLFAMLNTFAESLWGGSNAYTIVDMTDELTAPSPLARREDPLPAEQTLLNMQMMEKRYAYENEMLDAVSHGLTHKAELLLSNLSQFSMEQRNADPVRNLKNYCIIMNSLLRKAAERGSVHPLYLDSVSSDFARRIELVGSVEATQPLMAEMMSTYCRLVKKHAMARYSAPIRKALVCIDSDLAGDLSLSSLAAMQNISPGYLSSLFKKEVGQTLTDYVNSRRMEQAARMLRNGTLQIQTVAQYCGIPDVNYFSKLFKRYISVTPKAFRQSLGGTKEK